jgi:TonB family protein
MIDMLINLLEANALLAFFVLLYRLAYAAYPHFGINRWVLLGLPVLAFLGGFLSFSFSDAATPGTTTFQLRQFVISNSSSTGAGSIFSLNSLRLAGGVYALGVMGFLGVGLYHVFRLLRIVYRHPCYKKTDHTEVRVKSYSIFSFFRWLFWNPDAFIDAHQSNLVYQHELAHIRQKHSIDLILAYVVKSLCWFNPASYLLAKAIGVNLEYLADEAALRNSRANVSSYGQALMEQQLLQAANPLINRFHYTQIQNRVHMLSFKNQYRSQQMVNGLTVALLGALTAGLVACSANDETPKGDQQATASKSKTDETVAPKKVDQQPQFPGGKKALFKYIRKHVDYPESLKGEGISDTVITSFVIAENGQVEEVKLGKVKAEKAAFNQEAKAVIKAMPKWKPGKVDGEPVRVRYRLPIVFSN